MTQSIFTDNEAAVWGLCAWWAESKLQAWGRGVCWDGSYPKAKGVELHLSQSNAGRDLFQSWKYFTLMNTDEFLGVSSMSGEEL